MAVARTTKWEATLQRIRKRWGEEVLVIGLGFEPRTDSLEGYCSIQLSYPTNP